MSVANTLVEEDGFGFVQRPNDRNAAYKRRCYDVVRRYTMTNRGNSSVRLISWGAGIQSVKVPNDKGILGDVVLGFDTVDGYLTENRYDFARVTGGVKNRVSEDGMSGCDLREKGDPPSGNDDESDGFDRRLVRQDNGNWESCIIGQRVVMSNVCSTRDGRRRGVAMTQVKFGWTDENQLDVNIRATSTVSTPIDVATRCLFNLAGHGSGPDELRNHIVTVNAAKWTFMNLRNRITTGEIKPVNSTVYDLRSPTRLTAERLREVPGGGYDNNLCVDSPSCWCYRFHARMLHPGSGRFIEVHSNQPGIQFYTGNDLPAAGKRSAVTYVDERSSAGCGDRSNSNAAGLSERENSSVKTWPEEIRGKGGAIYRRHGGFMLSPQNYPNAANVEGFPKCVLRPGKTYVNDVTYKFGVLRRI